MCMTDKQMALVRGYLIAVTASFTELRRNCSHKIIYGKGSN